MVRPPASHLDLLERPIFAHFGTVRPDCTPLVNPMWFLWDGDEGAFRLTHTKKRHNYRYIQQQPRVALSIADPDDPYRYLQAQGVVERIGDDPEGRFYQLLQQRYRGYVSEVKDRDVRVVLFIRPLAFKAKDAG